MFSYVLSDILCLPIAYPACSEERLANRTANGGLKRNENKVSKVFNDLLHSFVCYFICCNNADNSNPLRPNRWGHLLAYEKRIDAS